jgi:anti-anti-sigma factor
LGSADGAVVIDLSGVTFMDCQGVTTLFEAVDRARAVGIGLSAVGSPACARLIRLIGLTKALAFYDHRDDVPQ